MADTQTPSVAEGEQPTVTEGAPQIDVETDAAAAVTVTPMTRHKRKATNADTCTHSPT